MTSHWIVLEINLIVRVIDSGFDQLIKRIYGDRQITPIWSLLASWGLGLLKIGHA
jgi:hypothetical protein